MKALFFDVGEVLLRFGYERVFAALAASTGRPAPLVAAFFSLEELVQRHESGRLPAARLLARLREKLGYAGSAAEFEAIWTGGCAELADNAALLREAAEAAPAYLLSNVGPLHWSFIRRRFAFPRYVRGAVLSYRVGARKPDPRLFEAALALARVRAADALLVDDHPRNVAAARRLGMRAILYRDGLDLRLRLRREGVPLARRVAPPRA